MPVFGLGTWQMGGRNERDLENNDEADISAIQRAIELGVTHIDTAEIYANGYTEELVGRAIKEVDRSKLFIVSKVYTHNLRHDDLIRAAHNSLKRLQTDYLDLYLTHRPNPTDISYTETMKALAKLYDEGLIKNIGVSNYNVAQMKEAQEASSYKIVANQVHYNLKIREVEKKGVLKYCQDNDMILIAWRPLQKDMLDKDSHVMQQLIKKYHKTPNQIALNWLISQQNVVTISKTTKPKHLKENLEATTFELEREDIEILRTEFPNQASLSDTVPLD